MAHLRYNKEKSKIGTPPGSILMFPASANLPGYLKCDGQVVTKKDYPTLYEIIGDAFKKPGETIAPTQFQLPDLGSKKIIANNSVRDDKYANVYLDDDNPSGGTRAGILINVESEIGDTYDLKYKGEFDFPDRVYTIDGEPKVTFALGNNTEETEITQFNLQAHGHYHSGFRCRITPPDGENEFFSANQTNFYNRRSSLDVGLWERNTFQLACDHYVSYSSQFNYAPPDGGGPNVSCNGSITFTIGCFGIGNCGGTHRKCIFWTQGISRNRRTDLNTSYCIYSAKNGQFPYRMKINFNGDLPGGDDLSSLIGSTDSTLKGTVTFIREEWQDSNCYDGPCRNTCSHGQATPTRCFGHGPYRNSILSQVRIANSNAAAIARNYGDSSNGSSNDRDNLPFDGRQSDKDKGPSTSVRNVTIPTDVAGTDQTHVHYVQRRIDGHKFELRALANRISATPLTSVVKVRTTTAEKLDRISQPFIIQEFFIKF